MRINDAAEGSAAYCAMPAARSKTSFSAKGQTARISTGGPCMERENLNGDVEGIDRVNCDGELDGLAILF